MLVWGDPDQKSRKRKLKQQWSKHRADNVSVKIAENKSELREK
ncbi:hypothetical protein P4V47_21825 [Brevibacillus laterosporus]|nr:hypothetical protein [Brevibacillus laterosporus]MED1790076.1 hypothetical protein [Brevibacillus laterosporus]